MPDDKLLTTAEVAALLRVKPQTIRKWRLVGSGPAYQRLGAGLTARVAYRASDVAAWLDARRYTSTAAETTGSATESPRA